MQDLSKDTVTRVPPDDFVDARVFLPDVQIDLKYFGTDNFTGKNVPGYEAEILLMTRSAALALQKVQASVQKEGINLRLFDAYRPQRAVDAFMHWAGDAAEHVTKEKYYPHLNKSQLIPLGYLIPDSSHSRGSTVDLTLVTQTTGKEVDMGTPFDFFDPLSWPSSEEVTKEQRSNRMRLRSVMLEHGFMPLDTEWWHFTLRDEPYTDTWFDFPVTDECRGWH